MAPAALAHLPYRLGRDAGWFGLGSLTGALVGVLALSLAWSPLHGLALAAAMAVLVVVSRHLFASLLVILVTVITLGSDSLLRIRLGFELVEVDALLLLAAFGAAVRVATDPSATRARGLDLLMIAFGWVMAVATVVGFLGSAPADNIRSELRPIGYLLGCYLIGRQSLATVRQIRIMMLAVLAATLIAGLKVVLVYATAPLGPPGGPQGEDLYLATRVMNSDGFKRVIAAGGEIFPVVVALGLLVYLGKARSLAHRFWLSLALIVTMMVNVISYTRSYWIGLVTGVVLHAVARPVRSGRWLWVWFAISTLALAGVGALVTSIQGRDALSILVERSAIWRHVDTDRGVHSRIAEGLAISEAVRESPLLGHGLGSEYTFYSESEGGALRTWEYTHNSYFYFLLKGGAVGLLAFLALLAGGWRSGLAVFRRTTSEETRAMAFIFSSALAVLAVVSLSAPWLTHFVGAGLAGSCLSVLAFLRERVDEGGTESREGGPGSMGGTATAGWSAAEAWRHGPRPPAPPPGREREA